MEGTWVASDALYLFSNKRWHRTSTQGDNQEQDNVRTNMKDTGDKRKGKGQTVAGKY